MDDGYLRIGEFSERVGVSPDLLRAWERRYGLLQPSRSPGGFRLYSDVDVARVERMTTLVEQGRSAAQAARLALDEVATIEPPEPVTPALDVDRARDRLSAALSAFDEQAAHQVLDDLLVGLHLDTVLRDVLLPYLRWVGEQWADGRLTVAQEHFASAVLRGRLLALTRGWGNGIGPRALLAAPPHEEHDLGLLILGLCLWRRGWRITFLGADTPIEATVDTARRLEPALIVVSAVQPDALTVIRDGLVELAGAASLVLGGAGAGGALAGEIGARHLDMDPVTAADVLTAEAAGSP